MRSARCASKLFGGVRVAYPNMRGLRVCPYDPASPSLLVQFERRSQQRCAALQLHYPQPSNARQKIGDFAHRGRVRGMCASRAQQQSMAFRARHRSIPLNTTPERVIARRFQLRIVLALEDLASQSSPNASILRPSRHAQVTGLDG